MTDRELLELAAKAAGIRQSGWVDDDPDIEPCIVAVDENDCAFGATPLGVIPEKGAAEIQIDGPEAIAEVICWDREHGEASR